MDYRKAWDAVKSRLEMAIEEGQDCGYDKPSDDMRVYGMYEAYSKIFRDMTELESEIVNTEIKVGDIVRVSDPGYVYPAYDEWIKDNISNPFFAARWGKERRLVKGLTGLVRYIAPHGTQDYTLAYVEISNACYIIALEGLEKVEEG